MISDATKNTFEIRFGLEDCGASYTHIIIIFFEVVGDARDSADKEQCHRGSVVLMGTRHHVEEAILRRIIIRKFRRMYGRVYDDTKGRVTSRVPKRVFPIRDLRLERVCHPRRK